MAAKAILLNYKMLDVNLVSVELEFHYKVLLDKLR